ncbi:MAG: glycine--tRNA ligase subunit alpha [Holosporales bacterium]|jgi:glycyl-tRNA synthetase alpha chain|nr:glycine--tRNA ligase subunit alpha [Holosporales bacterium]
MLGFQDIVLHLHAYWGRLGCAIVPPYDLEMGAGTFHPETPFRALGPHPWRVAYIQPSRRPADGRYAESPNRVQRLHQYQVILKPSPDDVQELYLNSLKEIGIDYQEHDIRFVEDDWESPTLGASGLGWEVWCDGMEISQFTYFQQIGGFECAPVTVELTYGLERIALFIQKVDDIYKINWNGVDEIGKITYGDIYKHYEREFSAYNFEYANVETLNTHFMDTEKACTDLLEQNLVFPAYDQCIKASHLFNLLDARSAISALERADLISRVRALAKQCFKIWLGNQPATVTEKE